MTFFPQKIWVAFPGMFNMHTDVNACDCTWRCMNTVRESAQKVDSGREKKTQQTCRIGELNLPQGRAGSTLYQLSYIPIQTLPERMTVAGRQTSISDIRQTASSYDGAA